MKKYKPQKTLTRKSRGKPFTGYHLCQWGGLGLLCIIKGMVLCRASGKNGVPSP